MSMKNISKALAMAVMMSVFCGSAYADYVEKGTVNGSGSLAVGNGSTIGLTGTTVANYSVAVGVGASATSIDNNIEKATAVGYFAEAKYNNTVAIGAAASANKENSVAIGYASETSEDNTVSVGNDEVQRRIVNVAKGEKDTDAVNKKQMEDAIAAIGTATYDDTAIKADIAKKADKTDLDAKADKADVEKNAADIADHETRIATLEAGGSGGASTEALEKLDSKINATDARMDRVGATAAALAAINYQPMAKGQSQVAIGMGGYNGKKATAIGLAYQFDNRISGSVAGAANGSEHMFNVGFNYLFGQHTAKDIAPMAASNSVSLKEAELQAQVDSLKADNQAMQAKMARLEAMIKALASK